MSRDWKIQSKYWLGIANRRKIMDDEIWDLVIITFSQVFLPLLLCV